MELSTMTIVGIVMALFGGVLRVVDGRGKEWLQWLPYWAQRGAIRSTVLILFGIACAAVHFGPQWVALWVGGLMGYGLVRGFPEGGWESFPKMFIHYSVPCVAAVVPLIAVSYFNISELAQYIDHDLAWTWPIMFVLTAIVAGYYWFKTNKMRNVDGLLTWLTEFLAGAALYGSIFLL